MRLPAPRSLRMQLLAAIVAVVLLATAISLVVGAVLTRRAVDRSVLKDVAQQADLLAERERVALLPLGHLESLRTFLARQHERAVVAPLGRRSTYLSADAARQVGKTGRSNGTISVGGKEWFYAARPVSGRALVLAHEERAQRFEMAERQHSDALALGEKIRLLRYVLEDRPVDCAASEDGAHDERDRGREQNHGDDRREKLHPQAAWRGQPHARAAL